MAKIYETKQDYARDQANEKLAQMVHDKDTLMHRGMSFATGGLEAAGLGWATGSLSFFKNNRILARLTLVGGFVASAAGLAMMAMAQNEQKKIRPLKEEIKALGPEEVVVPEGVTYDLKSVLPPKVEISHTAKLREEREATIAKPSVGMTVS